MNTLTDVNILTALTGEYNNIIAYTEGHILMCLPSTKHGETMIDALKNIIEADRTYMQNEQALEGWMFINLIALKWYYTILNLLKKKGLNKKYSPMDFLLFLSEIKKVKINDQWYNAEMTKKTRDLLQSLNILPIT